MLKVIPAKPKTANPIPVQLARAPTPVIAEIPEVAITSVAPSKKTQEETDIKALPKY